MLTFRAHGSCAPDLALRFGADERATRGELLFDGALSPAQLEAGDVVRSTHALDQDTAARMAERGVWLGLVRASGARPEPADPTLVRWTP